MRTFNETSNFTKKWMECGLTDEDLRILENVYLKDPKVEKAIRGTGGVRKVRILCGGFGKRSGARAIYVEIKEMLQNIDVAKYRCCKI